MNFLRKFISIIMIVVIFISTVSLAGCDFNTEGKLKKTIAAALEEKYGEEFVCYDVWGNGGGSYFGVCSPEKNHSMRFEALFYDTGGILYEGYYDACVSEPIEDELRNELENVFNDFYLHSYMTGPLYSFEENDIYAENVRNQNFDIDEYIKLESDGKVSLSVIILVNKKTPDKLSYEEEYQQLHDTIQRISEDNNIFVSVCLKFVPKKIYAECVDYLGKTSYARDTFDELVRDYPIKVTGTDIDFRFDFQGDTSITITKEEYINQRKEVN